MQTSALTPILNTLCRRLRVTSDELLSRCRRQDLVDARCLTAAWMMLLPGIRQRDVAALLTVSQAAVSKFLVRHKDMLYYAEYQQRWEKLKSETL